MSVQTHDPLRQWFAHAAPGGNTAGHSGSVRRAPLMAGSKAFIERETSDQVIQALLEAFEVAAHNDDRQCMEALQLVITARQFGLQPAGERAAKNDQVAARGRPVQALQKWRLKRVVDHIESSMSSKITLRDLAAAAGLSRMHFASQFRVATGMRPHEFLLQQRILRAVELMRDTTMTIMEITLTVGFQTQAHFTTVFKRFVGCTPRHWRVGNQMPPPSCFEGPGERTGPQATAW